MQRNVRSTATLAKAAKKTCGQPNHLHICIMQQHLACPAPCSAAWMHATAAAQCTGLMRQISLVNMHGACLLGTNMTAAPDHTCTAAAAVLFSCILSQQGNVVGPWSSKHCLLHVTSLHVICVTICTVHGCCSSAHYEVPNQYMKFVCMPLPFT